MLETLILSGEADSALEKLRQAGEAGAALEDWVLGLWAERGMTYNRLEPRNYAMATHDKPPATGGSHTLSFDKLAPGDFERLCLWLVEREGYSRVEHLGEAGSEGGRDVVAWKDGRCFVFQCKRVQAFNTSQARKEIEKLRRLPLADQPHELVFAVARTVSADTRDAIRKVYGETRRPAISGAATSLTSGSSAIQISSRSSFSCRPSHERLSRATFPFPPSGRSFRAGKK